MNPKQNKTLFTESSTNAVPPDENIVAERMAFAKRLNRLLLQRGWSQSDLARRAGLTSRTGKSDGRDLISKYCSGRNEPNRANLAKLARAFGCQPGDLMNEHSVAPPAPEPEPSGDGLQFKPLADGNVFLHLQSVLPMKAAAAITEIFMESTRKPA